MNMSLAEVIIIRQSVTEFLHYAQHKSWFETVKRHSLNILIC